MNAKITKRKFYLLSWTWGIAMNLVGAIVALAMIVTGHKPQKWNYCYFFEVGKYWGGVSFGMFFLKCKNGSYLAQERIKNHEHGHGIQNCYLGPIMPFLGIASVVRYWWRELVYIRRGKVPPTDYDDFWFEKSATELGRELDEHINVIW